MSFLFTDLGYNDITGAKLKKIILTILLLLTTTIYADIDISTNIKSELSSHLKGRFKDSVKSIYENNEYRALWVGDRNTQKFSTLLDALGDPLFNYKYKNFNQDKIIDISYNINAGAYNNSQMLNAMATLDILLTESYIELIHFIKVGDVDWNLVKRKMNGLKASQDVHAIWEINPRSMPGLDDIYKSINQNIKAYLTSLIPQEREYRSLISLLTKYRAMPKFKKISYGSLLKPHRMDDRIRSIKKLLQFTGDFPKNSSTGTGYSSGLVTAIRKFKERFNLAKGDYIDNKVINYLNTSKKEYIKKIIVNLDKLKIYPKAFESTYVEVNIPEFKLSYYENGKTKFESDIIVGRIDRPTPIFSDHIKYMVLNPTWTITDNLIKRDLIPVLKKNPDYLKEHNIHVFTSYKKNAKEVQPDLERLFKYENSKKYVPYRFVQFPSDKNALGRVKFMFPNKYDVYLHDTDNRSLFKYRYRVYSSGCMRVQKPFVFMNALLESTHANYSEEKIKNIFASNEPTTIRLKKSIPVHIVYQTVKRSDGKDYFLYDVYMYDQIIWESSAGHRKSTFKVPKQRLTGIKRSGSRIR